MVTKITRLLHRNNVSSPTRDTEVTRPCRSPLSFPCLKTQLPRLATHLTQQPIIHFLRFPNNSNNW